MQLGEPYSELAEQYLDKHVTVLSNWGSMNQASGLFTFKTPGTARAAKEYMEQPGVKTDVYNFFNRLSLSKRVVDEIPLVSAGALKVEVAAHYYIQKQNPNAFQLIKTMADVYKVEWPPNPGISTSMPGDYMGKAMTLKNWLDAVDAVHVDRLDTAYTSVLMMNFKQRVKTGFSVGCSLLFSYFSADSLYRVYAQDSPYPAMATAILDSLGSEAVKFKTYMTVAKHLIEPSVDTLITNPDGSQVYKTLPPKKGTMWEFLSEYHPDLAGKTQSAMSALGVSLP